MQPKIYLFVVILPHTSAYVGPKFGFKCHSGFIYSTFAVWGCNEEIYICACERLQFFVKNTPESLPEPHWALLRLAARGVEETEWRYQRYLAPEWRGFVRRGGRHASLNSYCGEEKKSRRWKTLSSKISPLSAIKWKRRTNRGCFSASKKVFCTTQHEEEKCERLGKV